MEWFNFKLPEFLRPNRTKLLFLSSVVGVSYLIYLTAKLFRRDKRINSPDDRNSLDESELVGGVPFSYIRDELARKRLRPLKAEMKTTSRQKSGEVRSESRSRNESRSRQESRLEDIETEKDDTSSSIFTGHDNLVTEYSLPAEKDYFCPCPSGISLTRLDLSAGCGVSDLNDICIEDDVLIQKAVVDLNSAISQLEGALQTISTIEGVSPQGLRSSSSIQSEINRLKRILNHASSIEGDNRLTNILEHASSIQGDNMPNNIIKDFVEEDLVDGSYEPETFAIDPTLERRLMERIPDDDNQSTASDDSFVSASGDVSLEMDCDDERSKSIIALERMILDLVNRNSNLDLYMMGIEYFTQYGIPVRKLRTQILKCENDVDFCVKVHCVRKAFEVVLASESTRRWFIQAGKDLVSKFLKKADKDYLAFQSGFDDIISFCEKGNNWGAIEEELTGRKVCSMSFYDIICDFMILDAFTDLENPPYAVTTVTQNRWLSTSIKETALTTTVWSLLAAKTRMLKNPDGFMAKFYQVCQHMTPVLAWGFLGPVEELREICMSFRGTLLGFLQDMFSVSKVNYGSTRELAEDIIRIAQIRKREADEKLS